MRETVGALVRPCLMPIPDPVRAYIGLGANLGDRLGALRGAVAGLQATTGVMVCRVSPVYESAAHTLDPEEVQPPFLNAVVEVETLLSPEALLAAAHALERAAGRTRRRRWAPRPLDVDVLVYGTVRRSGPGIEVPHPRLGERRFVLQPLVDLAPNLRVPPPFDAPAASLLRRCPDEAPLVRTPYSLHDPA